MEGAKGGCLAVLVADAGWHGKDTGLCAQSRIPIQVPGVPEDALCCMRMRHDLLYLLHLEQISNDNLPLTIEHLQYPQHRRTCWVQIHKQIK